MAKTVEPPLQAFLDQAVREYRDKILERILTKEVRKPWMKYREIRVMEDLLSGLRPKRALEWGAGYGTSHFSRLMAPGGAWIAIEHDPEWASRIRQEAPANVEIHAVPGGRQPWLPENGDGTYGDFQEYVEYPSRLGPFDFILSSRRPGSFFRIRSSSRITAATPAGSGSGAWIASWPRCSISRGTAASGACTTCWGGDSACERSP
jgi:hypothetical protein